MVSANRSDDLVALDDALQTLAKYDARKCQIVELRFFGGLSVDETAEAMKLSPITNHARMEQGQGMALSGTQRGDARWSLSGGNR